MESTEGRTAAGFSVRFLSIVEHLSAVHRHTANPLFCPFQNNFFLSYNMKHVFPHRRVLSEDEGFYFCEASNGMEKVISQPAYLLPAGTVPSNVSSQIQKHLHNASSPSYSYGMDLKSGTSQDNSEERGFCNTSL